WVTYFPWLTCFNHKGNISTFIFHSANLKEDTEDKKDKEGKEKNFPHFFPKTLKQSVSENE
ncbi:hypothetical protein, partial [Bacteroides sp.]|uniref:hypothetical protein n=1 Tax=Bacteroides sp. TaxID=29523 RepID=UPI001DFBB768